MPRKAKPRTPGRPPLGKKAMTAAERKRRQRAAGRVTAETLNAAIVDQFKVSLAWYCNDRSEAPRNVWDIYERLLEQFPEAEDQRRIAHYLIPAAEPGDIDDAMTLAVPAGNVRGRRRK